MKTGFISVGNSVCETLLAISEQEQEQGLMHVVPPVPYMAFVYAEPKVNKFWMKNTPSALDIIFCCNNKVSQICQGMPYSTDMIGADQMSDLVIELPYGEHKRLDIKIGTPVRLL